MSGGTRKTKDSGKWGSGFSGGIMGYSLLKPICLENQASEHNRHIDM